MTFIRLDNISFYYTKKIPIIKNLNLLFGKGEFTAIMGPNGSGKTTLGKLLVGILKPRSGNIFIDQKDSARMRLAQIGSKIGYLFQNPELQIFSTTVSDELSFIPRLHDRDPEQINEEMDRVLNLLHLSQKKNSITFHLSYGEKQRLAIAAILLNKPQYLVLDEPTTGLDMARKEELVSILKQLLDAGIGMSVITHDEKFVKDFEGRLIKICGGDFIETGIG